MRVCVCVVVVVVVLFVCCWGGGGGVGLVWFGLFGLQTRAIGINRWYHIFDQTDFYATYASRMSRCCCRNRDDSDTPSGYTRHCQYTGQKQ